MTMRSSRYASPIAQLSECWQIGLGLFLLVICHGGLASDLEYDLNQARQQLLEGDAQAAYELLYPLHDQYAGEQRYDYLLGASAVDSGNPSIALFALQRVLLQSPSFAGARMELARAYFNLGEMDAARQHFTILLATSPPADVKLAIEAYLLAIEQVREKPNTRWQARVTMGSGFDSNANSATDENQFLGFDLSENSIANSSSFLLTKGEIDADLFAWQRWSFAASLSSEIKDYRSADFINYQSSSLSVVGQRTWARYGVQVNSSSVYTTVDEHFNNRGHYLSANGFYQLNKDQQIALFMRFGQLHYSADQSAKDVSQTLLGISLSGHVASDKPIVWVMTALAGEDEPLESDSIYKKSLAGLRLTAYFTLNTQVILTPSVGMSIADFEVPFSGMDREDSLYDAKFDMSIRPTKNWVVTTSIGYTRNDSTVLLYDYDKSELSVSAAWEF